MSVYDIFFVFGKPGTYLLAHPSASIARNMPLSLVMSVNNLGGMMKAKCVAIDANDNYNASWTNKFGMSYWLISPGLHNDYPEVGQCIQRSGLQPTETYTVFGSNIGDCIAVCGGQGLLSVQDWSYPRTFPRAIGESLDDGLHIKSAALGINHSYFILYTNGSYTYKCTDDYPDLSAVVKKCERGDIVFVAMNPHRRNEYFIALANSRVHIRASAICEADIVNVLSVCDNLEVISSHVSNFSHDVAIRPDVPQKYRKREFLKAIAASVGGAVTTTLVTAALTAACNVM